MLTFDTVLTGLLTRLTYKPDMELKMHDTMPMLTVVHYTPNSRTAAHERIQVGHPIAVPLLPAHDEKQVFNWLRGQLRRVECHEMDEWLQLDGKIVNDPHMER